MGHKKELPSTARFGPAAAVVDGKLSLKGAVVGRKNSETYSYDTTG